MNTLRIVKHSSNTGERMGYTLWRGWGMHRGAMAELLEELWKAGAGGGEACQHSLWPSSSSL